MEFEKKMLEAYPLLRTLAQKNRLTLKEQDEVQRILDEAVHGFRHVVTHDWKILTFRALTVMERKEAENEAERRNTKDLWYTVTAEGDFIMHAMRKEPDGGTPLVPQTEKRSKSLA